MEPQQIFSESHDILSISMVELAREEDPDLQSLMGHVQQNEFRINEFKQIFPKLQTNAKDQQGKKNTTKAENTTKQLMYDEMDNIKQYYSQCNDVYSSENIKKKHRKTKIINQNHKIDKRKRIKNYVQMLQAKCAQLSSQLQKMKKLNQMNKDYIRKLNQSQQLLNGFFVGKQQIYQKLEGIIKVANVQNQRKSTIAELFLDKKQQRNDQHQLSKINKSLLSQFTTMRMRLGVFGKDRIKVINYFFRQMVEMVLPDYQKYLVYTAQNEIDLFSILYLQKGQHEQNVEQWRRQMLDNLNLNIDQIKLIHELKEQVLAQKKVFDDLLNSFYKIKCQMCKQARVMEKTFDKIHQKMAPIEIAKSLLFIERYRYKKGISTTDSIQSIINKLDQDQFIYDEKDPFGISQIYTDLQAQ